MNSSLASLRNGERSDIAPASRAGTSAANVSRKTMAPPFLAQSFLPDDARRGRDGAL